MPCTTCGKLVQKYKMTLHIQMAHTSEEDRRYQCPFCQKGFVVKRRLEDHINTHTGKKPYVCKICDYSCGNYDNYLAHVRKHGKVESNLDRAPLPSTLDRAPLPSSLDRVPLPSTLDRAPLPSTLDRVPLPSNLDKAPLPLNPFRFGL